MSDTKSPRDIESWSGTLGNPLRFTIQSNRSSVKKIPAMFRGAALRSIFKEADAQCKTQIDVVVLQKVNEQRRAG